MHDLKPSQGQFEEYLRTTAQSILRNAKAAIWEDLPNMGEENFISHQLRQIEKLLPKVVEKVEETSFRILNARNTKQTEVMFHIPVDGPITPLTSISTHFRLRGEIGVDKGGVGIYLYYREPHSTTAERLVEVYRHDLDLIHQYLDFGRSLIDNIVTDAKVQLTQEINLIRETLGPLPVIATELQRMGFKRREMP
jgi:hypothetical protein